MARKRREDIGLKRPRTVEGLKSDYQMMKNPITGNMRKQKMANVQMGNGQFYNQAYGIAKQFDAMLKARGPAKVKNIDPKSLPPPATLEGLAALRSRAATILKKWKKFNTATVSIAWSAKRYPLTEAQCKLVLRIYETQIKPILEDEDDGSDTAGEKDESQEGNSGSSQGSAPAGS